VLQTSCIDFATMQRLRRFSRYWDLVCNSGNFVQTTPLIWGEGPAFASFLGFSDWLYTRVGRQHAIALHRLAELLFTYLVEEKRHDPAWIAQMMWGDYRRGVRRDAPDFLRPYVTAEDRAAPLPRSTMLRRQARHLGD
jgi:hypothetical protein